MVQTDRQKIRTNQQALHVFFGIVAALLAYVIVGSLGLYLLKISWAGYATAGKNKSYTFEMLLARLFVGILAATAAGISATRTVNDNGKTAWFVGSIVFSVATYVHLFWDWTDYPVWYHLAYLLPIIPVIGVSYFLFKRK